MTSPPDQDHSTLSSYKFQQLQQLLDDGSNYGPWSVQVKILLQQAGHLDTSTQLPKPGAHFQLGGIIYHSLPRVLQDELQDFGVTGDVQALFKRATSRFRRGLPTLKNIFRASLNEDSKHTTPASALAALSSSLAKMRAAYSDTPQFYPALEDVVCRGHFRRLDTTIRLAILHLEQAPSISAEAMQVALENVTVEAKPPDVVMAVKPSSGKVRKVCAGGHNMHPRYCKECNKDTTCADCGNKGHPDKGCWRCPQCPQSRRNANPGPSSSSAYSSVALRASRVQTGPAPAIILTADSACTDHLVHDETTLTQCTPSQLHLQTANGTMLPCTMQGTLAVTDHLKVHAHVAPGLTTNLLSLPRLCDDGYQVTLTQTGGAISDGSIVTPLQRTDGLWTLQGPTSTALAVSSSTLDLWHRRLGHIHEDAVKKTAAATKGMPSLASAPSAGHCTPCHIGKGTRASFPSGRHIRAAHVGDLVHSDVCGPFPVESRPGGYRYYVAFLDDFSGYRHAYPIRHKSDVTDAYVRYKDWIRQVAPGKVVKRLRTDGGGEYASGTLQEILREDGTAWEHSSPATPEQNGAAERLNRTMVEAMRTLLTSSGLPKSLWAEALGFACYTQNRCILRGNTKTPYELVYGRSPGMHHLRVFGATAYASTSAVNRDKLDPRAVVGRMVGYAPNMMAYRILLPNWTIISTIHVSFDESTPPPRILPDDVSSAASIWSTPPANVESEDFDVWEDAETEPLVEPDVAFVAPEPQPDPPVDPAPEEVGPPAPVPAGPGPDSNVADSGVSATNILGAVLQRMTRSGKAYLVKVPTTRNQAKQSPDKDKWSAGEAAEVDTLEKNGVFERVRQASLPPGTHCIGSTLVYRVKYMPDGSAKFKVRLVAQGYSQRPGIDFILTFAPVIRAVTVRLLLAMAAHHDWSIRQLDVTSAFLLAPLKEVIYVRPPKGLEPPGTVWRLRKSLYGLKQAPLVWHEHVGACLAKLGLTPSIADPCLYKGAVAGGPVFLGLYVDDFLIVGPPTSCDAVVAHLSAAFPIKDEGEASCFLGLEIRRDRPQRQVSVSQQGAIARILEEHKADIPGIRTLPASPDVFPGKPSPEEVAEASSYPYRRVVGQLMHISTMTRPDIAFAVGYAARYNSAWGPAHVKYVKGILGYLVHTAEHTLLLNGFNPLQLAIYSDASWRDCPDNRSSTMGLLVQLGAQCPVLWNSRKQTCISESTTEAELQALTKATKAARWLTLLLQDLCISTDQPIPIHVDNQPCLRVTANPSNASGSLHLLTQIHYVHQFIQQRLILPVKCATADMLADPLTKPLPGFHLRRLLPLLGIVNARSLD
jgi:transposase InsO family protein